MNNSEPKTNNNEILYLIPYHIKNIMYLKLNI